MNDQIYSLEELSGYEAVHCAANIYSRLIKDCLTTRDQSIHRGRSRLGLQSPPGV